MKCSVAMQCVLVSAVVVCLCTMAAAEEAEHHLTAAFAWLEQTQDLERGFWGPNPVRDTSTVLQTVQLFSDSGIDVSAAQEYLSAQQPVSTDYLALKIMALSVAGQRVEQDVADLLLRRNSDGGFGFLDGYPSSVIDSFMALDALVLADVDDDSIIGSALGYLIALQHSSGTFSYDREGPASLEVTCRALLAMHRLQPRYNLSSFITLAAGFIAAQQKTDGGFGEDESTVVETAFALQALQAAGLHAQAVLEARTNLLSVQNPVDGSWNGRVRDTACALAALYASSGIDLANLQVHPSGISLQPAYPAVGQQVTVSCEVRNTGSIAAENIEIELYLGDPEAEGQFLYSGTIALLAAGGSAGVQLTFKLSDDPGHADLYVIVDPRNLIPEITNADNVAIKSFTSGTLPDLVIARIDLSTASPQADEPFTVSASVQNLGESDAGPVMVGLYPGDPAITVPLLEVELDNVCGGCSGRADFDLTLPAGTYEYVVSVSADAGVVEEEFDNNDKPCTFTVVPAMSPGLDLAVTESGIVFSPAYPREDEPISISAAIRNQGEIAARDAVVEIYAVDTLQVSILLHTFSGIDVGAGNSVNLTLDGVRLAAGTYGIFVNVTAAPTQQDAAPDNNIASKTLTVFDVQDVVDLAVDDLSFSPSMPHAGDSVIVRFRITNHGNIGLAGITFGVYDNDPRNGGTLVIDSLQTLPFLKAGELRYASGVFDTAGRGGEQTLYVFVDAANAVSEVDEENNIVSDSFTVVHDPASDLVVNAEGLEFSPAYPLVDDELRINCTVYNQGSSNISGAFQVALYAGLPQGDMQPVAVATIDRLDANAYVQLVFTTQAALFAASQTIFVHADYKNTIVETNEYNNTVRMNIAVSAPDLSISDVDLSIESDPVLPGQPFALNGVIHNVGEIDATNVAAAVFNGPPGNGQELARVSLPLVAAGSSETVVFPISLPAGSHTLHVVIDPDGYVAESGRANNSASIVFNVSLPDGYAADLVPVSLNLENYACDNQKLTVSGTVAVTFANAGSDAVELPFGVLIFEDRNINNAFDPVEDVVLGSIEIKGAVPAGAVINVEIPVSGSLLFAGNRLYMFVDSENAIAEPDEDNNIRHSLADCIQPPLAEPCIDISASQLRIDNGNLPDSATITVRVGNGGAANVDSGIDVALYDGNPADNAILLGTVQTSSALVAGAYEDVTFVLDYPTEGDYVLFAVVDDDGTGQGQLTENNKANNTAFAQVIITSSVNSKDTAVAQGSQWLVDHQHRLGGWEAFTPARANAATLQALHISGLYQDPEFSAMYSRFLQRVRETQASNGSWENGLVATAESMLALLACGEDSSLPAIRNAVIWFKRAQQDDGGWNNSPPQTGHAVWALMEAGANRDDPAILKARQWLLATRNTDGFWGKEAGEPSHEGVFHYAVVGLHWACDDSDTVGQDAITKAVAWLRAQGWRPNRSETDHNCSYLNALFYTGRNSGDIAAVLSSLKGLQRSNGGWLQINVASTPLEDPRATAEAVISLYRHSATGGGADILKAFRWLKAMTTEPNGDLPYPYDQASPTSAALLALNVVNDQGEFNEAIGEALIRIVITQKTNGNWHNVFSMNHSKHKHLTAGAAVLRALGETGLDVYHKSNATIKATNYLITYQNDDGGWPYYSYPAGLISEISPTILSLLGLLSNNIIITDEQRADLQGGIEWLLQQKTGAANWETISYTANIVKILNKFGEYQSEIDEAVAWLKQCQNPDGGWGEYESTIQTTASVVLALIQTGNQGAETARAVQWLLAVQNDDGGWPILPGIPNSSTDPTSLAVRALVLADYTPGPELAISFDKPAYLPGETVTISVEPKDDAYDVQQVSGIVAEYGGANHSIAFAKVGRTFIGMHVLSAGHIAGTDVVSIEAQTLEGIPGYCSGIFVVENKSGVLADLSIAASDIMFSPELPDEGRMVLIAVRVDNIGNAASAPAVVHFLNGTQPIGVDQALGSLAPGESDIVFMQWDTHGQLGRNYIHVKVDPDQAVADADRENNSAVRPIDVAQRSLPDLAVRDSDIVFASTSPIEGAQVDVFATVRNLGADVDGVAVHFYDGDAAPENLIAERIIYQIVPFGGSITVRAVFDTAGRSGERCIIVKADAVNVIREQDEANNTGTARLDVSSNGLTLELGLDRDSYAHGYDVLLVADITNNFNTERTVILEVLVIDSTGEVMAWPAQGRIIVLAPGATEVRDDLVWNTGSAMAGEWSVVATVFEDNQRRATSAALFSILADMSITASVRADRQVYYEHEQVVVSSLLRSYSPNYAFTDLSAVFEIMSPEGQVLYMNVHDIAQLHPLASASWEQSWNTALNSPGLYALNLDVMQEGRLVASDTVYITIAGSASGGRGLSAYLSAEPGQVYRGQDVELSYGVSNSGNAALDELGLYVKAVCLATQEVVLDIDLSCLFEGNTCSGTSMIHTSMLACGDYLILLGTETEGVEHNLACAPLSIVNRCPVAVAGENVLAHVGDIVQIDGSASYDVDGDSLSYSWELASVPEGSSAELTGPDQYNPVMLLDRHGTYELRLRVSDGMCLSQPDSVLVTTLNRPPVAIAGESMLVDVGETVQLDASESYDPDNDVIEHYEWIMVSRPAGSMAALSDRFAPSPVFTVDIPGAYRLQLVVRDFEYASDPVELEVTTRNRRPVADCGADREVEVGDGVQLDSLASYDPDFDTITYRWALLSVPEGSLCALDNATSSDPVFTADMPGAYIVQLIVSDTEFDSIPVTCIITTRNRPPVAVVAADPQQAEVGEYVSLSAAASSDPDGDALTFLWNIAEKPASSTAAIDEPHIVETGFVPDVAGAYQIVLSVSDGINSSSDSLRVLAVDDAPPECSDDLGIAQQYSVFALNTVASNHAVVGGRIAAGGDANLHNVVMGRHVPHGAPAEPVLVAGGDIVYSSGLVHRGSIVSAGSVEGISDAVRRTMARGATVTGYTDLPFEFEQESLRLRQLATRLAELSTTGTPESFATILILRGDGSSPIQIFSISAQQARSARSLHLKNIPPQATVIVNISGAQGGFSSIGMAIPGRLRGRVLFNFFEALSLDFTAVAVTGSLLAPFAELTNSNGIMFGTAVVGAWQGSMNVWHEPFIGILPECEPEYD